MNMNLGDKLGALDHEKVFGWEIIRNNDSKDFAILVWVRNKGNPLGGGTHTFQTKSKKTLHEAADEAIEILREHLADCSLC